MQPIPTTFVQNIADCLQYIFGAIDDPHHFLFICHQFKTVYYLISDIIVFVWKTQGFTD